MPFSLPFCCTKFEFPSSLSSLFRVSIILLKRRREGWGGWGGNNIRLKTSKLSLPRYSSSLALAPSILSVPSTTIRRFFRVLTGSHLFGHQRPKTPVVSLLDKIRGATDEERAEKAKEDGDLLANSILNHQTNSIRQVRGHTMHCASKRDS